MFADYYIDSLNLDEMYIIFFLVFHTHQLQAWEIILSNIEIQVD